MILMQRIIAIIILLYILPANLFSEEQDYPEKLEIKGILENWAWANTQNKLALLVEDDDIYEILFIETGPLQTILKIVVPDYLSIRSMEWTSDDSGLIILTDKCDEYRDGVAFLSIKNRSFENDYNYHYIGFSSSDQLYSITYEPKIRCWATLSAGEGHPDITVSRDGKDIITTSVYPGVVWVIGWYDGKLYFSSSLPLKTHLYKNKVLNLKNAVSGSQEERLNNKDIIYSIDIKSGELKEIDNVFIPDIRQTSKNGGQFYFQYKIQDAENKTIIHMW